MSRLASLPFLAAGACFALTACGQRVVTFAEEPQAPARTYPPGAAAPLSLLGGPDQSEGTPSDKALDCSVALGVLAGTINRFNLGVSATQMAALQRARGEYRRRAEELAAEGQDLATMIENREAAAQEDPAGEVKRAVQCLRGIAA